MDKIKTINPCTNCQLKDLCSNDGCGMLLDPTDICNEPTGLIQDWINGIIEEDEINGTAWWHYSEDYLDELGMTRIDNGSKLNIQLRLFA